MTLRVSDVISTSMRHPVLGQAVLAFCFQFIFEAL
jgi:uncharacterized membrane protein